MPTGLVRYHQTGHSHFVTFSCHQRKPYLGIPAARDNLERSLEKIRQRYDFYIRGYVIMPEHVHLLISEPAKAILATAIQAIKLSMVVQSKQRPFWLARYYDFNVFTNEKSDEKLHYMHQNPVNRGLVELPEQWSWSSFLHHAEGTIGTVEIESEWTATRRNRTTNHHHPEFPMSRF